MLSQETADEIKAALTRYPRPRSAVLDALRAVQRQLGYCPVDALAEAQTRTQPAAGFLAALEGKSFLDLCQLGLALTWPVALAAFFAAILSPMAAIAFGFGPMKTMPASRMARANPARSDRKP